MEFQLLQKIKIPKQSQIVFTAKKKNDLIESAEYTQDEHKEQLYYHNLVCNTQYVSSNTACRFFQSQSIFTE